MQQRKNKNGELDKAIESERDRLYRIADQLGLSAELTLKQSQRVDELIVKDLICQLDMKEKEDRKINVGQNGL